jgi:hypothetical protein
MYPGENPGHSICPLCLDFHNAVCNPLTRFPEDQHDIECRTSAHANQQHLHWPNTQVAATTFRWAIHDYGMATA